ncbi:MAG: hypothetical protein AB7G06_09370 [Bdellovibrionales bacterium]
MANRGMAVSAALIALVTAQGGSAQSVLLTKEANVATATSLPTEERATPERRPEQQEPEMTREGVVALVAIMAAACAEAPYRCQ